MSSKVCRTLSSFACVIHVICMQHWLGSLLHWLPYLTNRCTSLMFLQILPHQKNIGKKWHQNNCLILHWCENSENYQALNSSDLGKKLQCRVTEARKPTNKHSVFMWMSGVFYNWNDICSFFRYIYEITARSVRKFNCIHKTILKSNKWWINIEGIWNSNTHP